MGTSPTWMNVFKIVAIIIFVIAIIAGIILGVSYIKQREIQKAFYCFFGFTLGALFELSCCMVFVYMAENSHIIRENIQMIQEKTCNTNDNSDFIDDILSHRDKQW